MNKTVTTLKQDIEHVIRTGEGWTPEIADWVGESIETMLNDRMSMAGESRKPTLRMSNLGEKCDRKTWFNTRLNVTPAAMPASTLMKFLFGDFTEIFMIGLAMAAGHKVEAMQEGCEILGVKGHMDCIIDGMVFDVKSASSFAFNKFKNNELKEEGKDSFGYISQLSSYLYSKRDDTRVTYKNKGAFLAFDKQLGHIAVDVYDLTDQLIGKNKEVQHKINIVASDEMPPRGFDAVPEGKSGNMKLGTNCSYCDHKFNCWPNLRGFAYSNGPVYLTEVVKEPKVMEIT